MERPSLSDEASPFPSANGSSHSVPEIWSFPLSGSGGVLGAKRGHSGQNLCGFGKRRIDSRDVLVDGSTVLEQSRRSGGGRKRRDAAASEDESSKLVCSNNGNDMLDDTNAKRLKTSGSRDENCDSISEVEASSRSGGKPAKQSTQPSEPPKQDYIHVRARRGQATDSHSLAERARREKIGEKMKILQDLVPGCDKVIGKALVLDEIINYIQSLQRQVEFLSVKLEAVNSRMDPSIDGFPLKDFAAQTIDTAGMAFGALPTREYCQGSVPEWLHMQVGGSYGKVP